MTDTANSESLLILNRAPGVGAKHFRALLERFGAPADVLRAKRDQLAKAGLPAKAIGFLRNPDRSLIEKDLAWLRDPAHTIISLFDQNYPERLSALPDAPPALFVKGDRSLLRDPQIAIVGSRSPTVGGRKIAYDFANELAKAGILITSGLAYGIDSRAHHGALDAKAPTVAVIATGPDIIYPAQNKELAQTIARNGAIVSEFPCGTPPIPSNFPQRNRIISGLSLGVIVVEASMRSGSLITARLANEQGREVFAIPGSVHNPLSKGCHHLIRSGATLAESVPDVLAGIRSCVDLEALSPAGEDDDTAAGAAKAGALDASHLRLLEQMGYDPVTADTLAERTDTPIEEVASMLLMLELENYVSSGGGGFYCRIN